MPLEPAYKRVSVAELHRLGVVQAAAPSLQAIAGLAVLSVEQADAGDERCAGHAIYNLPEESLQSVELLCRFDQVL